MISSRAVLHRSKSEGGVWTEWEERKCIEQAGTALQGLCMPDGRKTGRKASNGKQSGEGF